MGFGVQLAAATTAMRTTEANITRVTTHLMEQSQLSHRAFDDAMASAVMDRYIDSLDPSRSLFVQSDIDEFAQYRPTLATSMRDDGDTRAAHAIFARYLERLENRTAYVTNALRTSVFEFSGHDVYVFDREKAPRPRDLQEARAIWLQRARADYLQEKLAERRPEQIVKTLVHRQAQELRTMQGLHGSEVLEIYLNALAHVYDPHSDYLGREEMESFSIAMKLSLSGIGATLENVDGVCTIRELTPGGPAARSGLVGPGDHIVDVAQGNAAPVDIANMPLSRVVEQIRGPKGSTVTLTVVPAHAADGSLPRSVAIVRDDVRLEDREAKARILDLPVGSGAPMRVGVIDLPSFYSDAGQQGAGSPRSLTADVARLLAKLKQERVRGIVLDLRQNGGGSLQEAISLTGLFIRTGPVVQTRDEAGHIQIDSDTDPAVQYDGPLVVLTSRFSASASEILAGALQDYGRALVVGDSSTFGKGTVQSVLSLAQVMDRVHLPHAYDPGALKITIDKFYRPSGASTQLRGVASDIVLPSVTEVIGVSESTLKDALPWDTVEGTTHDNLGRVAPYVAALRGSSARRIAHDAQFADLADDIARMRTLVATKTVSLNETERRDELSAAKARDARRDEASRSASTPRTTVYEITLENAAQAGLPAPLVLESARDRGRTSTAPAADERARQSGRRSPMDDLGLNESARILADYIGVLGG